MRKTLLLLAAGRGSRYGGLKQIDPVGPSGETLLDYSVFDALQAGFSRAVFVIRRDFEKEFRENVGRRFESQLDVDYVFQQLNDLPEGFNVPTGREKPWGTGHAIWCARHTVDEPFLAINADDFYGRGAIKRVGDFLNGRSCDIATFCMAGYRLDSTLSPSGSVSRGVCDVSADGLLKNIREMTKIERLVGKIVNQANGAQLNGNERVSMNCWGFTPQIFDYLGDLFSQFLASHGGGEKTEFYIPDAISRLISNGSSAVHVLPVESQWFGVTYREDRPLVVAALAELVNKGEYPSPLWS